MVAGAVRTSFLGFYRRHQVPVAVLMFGLGFLFDVLTIRRIDSHRGLLQQALYLTLLGGLLLLEIRKLTGGPALRGRAERLWEYHGLVVHFLFGSLLSWNTIFYFSSASAVTSFGFILLLGAVMVANEVGKARAAGIPLRITLFSVCTLSYFLFLYPIFLGKLSQTSFWLGFASSLALVLLLWAGHGLEAPRHWRKVILPALAVHLTFLVAHETNLIPPVPVAVKKIGVYHGVEKIRDRYYGRLLAGERRFWPWGPQTFLARPGDKLTVVLSIFSPRSFADKITLKWFREQDGWRPEDEIPLNILGGREKGYRGYAIKQFFAPGDWKVIVETSDGREVGRLRFTVVTDLAVTPRTFRSDRF